MKKIPRLSNPVLIASLICGAAVAYYAMVHGGGRQTFASRSWVLLIGIAGGLLAKHLLQDAARRSPWMTDMARPPTRTIGWVYTVGVFLATIGYLIFANDYIGRSLTPWWHDDQMHVIQARILAAGHLSLPQHELADFFETFHVFVKPVYGGIHFLGTSLINAPALMVGLPPYAMPLVIAGLIAALTYRILTALIGHWPAMLGVLLLWSLDQYRFVGPRMTSHAPVLLAGLLFVICWLNWRRRPHVGWMLAMGLCAGFAAITRPLDAAAYALPVAVAVLFTLRRLPFRKAVAQVVVGVAAAMPFLSLQLYFNHDITGDWLNSPYQYYNELNYPNINYGAFNPGEKVATTQVSQLPQKQEYYDDFLMRFLAGAERKGTFGVLKDRLAMSLRFSTPDTMLCLLLPLGLLALRRPTLVFAAIPAIYIALYTPHLFYLPHYPTIIAPSVIMLLLLGVRALHAKGGHWPWAAAAAVGVMIVASVVTTPPMEKELDDAGPGRPHATYANIGMPKIVKPPAIVLFHYSPGFTSYHDEPVYNTSTASPDDAPIIRAHDLGPERNLELLRYYAKQEPQRIVWSVDRGTGKLLYLGPVRLLLSSGKPVGIPFLAATHETGSSVNR